MLLHVDPNEITEANLRALVDGAVPERSDVEYKQGRYGWSDDDKKKLLKDLSAFANSDGSHIVIGMSARESVAVEVSGIDGDVGAEIQ